MKPDLGRIEIQTEECKGCSPCIQACNLKVLDLPATPIVETLTTICRQVWR